METILAILGTVGGLVCSAAILALLGAAAWPDWIFLPLFLILWLVCDIALVILMVQKWGPRG